MKRNIVINKRFSFADNSPTDPSYSIVIMSSPKVSISDVCLDAETPKNVYLSAKYKR